MSSAYLYLPDYFQSLDSRVRDFYFKVRGPEKVSDDIVIVDKKKKSIKELGQWPWERDKFAKILQNLTALDAGIIGLDVIFSEADKTSPTSIAKQYNLQNSRLPDYDAILARTVAQTPTILGFVFDFTNTNENEAPQIPAIFIQKHKQENYLPQAKGVLTNLQIIQSSAYSSGYMNNIPDDSGMIRSVPMFISYDMEVYPSLAVEMYRIGQGAQKIEIDYNEAGIEQIKIGKKKILSDRFGRLYLNFRGVAKSYTYISAVDIYNGIVEKSRIAGKYIFIGTSAYGIMDLRATPLDSVMPGVEIHANLLDNLLHQDMLHKADWAEAIDLLIIIFTTAMVLFAFSRLSLLWLIIVYHTAFFTLLALNYNVLFTQHIILNSIFPIFTMILSILALLGVNYFFEFRQKELIKGSFSKKVSKQVMDDLLLHPESSDLSSKEVEVTIYFSDIRSFTTISEDLKTPQRITDFLNYYMNAMVESVEKYSGTIDKFIGDAVMAYWNAPLKVQNHADKAVLTALEQIKKRDELNKTIQAKFGFDVDYGIGINTANVVVGEIGSKGRSDYTIIGDGVNLASRLEELCKAYKVRLIISEYTKIQLKEKYVIQLLDIVNVKGKHEAVKIYEVLAVGEVSKEKENELSMYEKAHTLYMQAEFMQAKTLFEKLFNKYEKYIYTLYAQRCMHLITEDIKNFDGIFEFKTK